MADKPTSTPSTSKPTKAPAYISSTGQTLNSLPLSARINNFTNDIYNLLGLYFVSLLSLDPYAAARNSRFNTRGRGRNAGSGAGGSGRAAGDTGSSGLFGSQRLGGGPPGGNGPRGGGGGGRRMGTVDDVRGPECGSCG